MTVTGTEQRWYGTLVKRNQPPPGSEVFNNIIFMLDTTGSMSPYSSEVRSSCRGLIPLIFGDGKPHNISVFAYDDRLGSAVYNITDEANAINAIDIANNHGLERERHLGAIYYSLHTIAQSEIPENTNVTLIQAGNEFSYTDTFYPEHAIINIADMAALLNSKHWFYICIYPYYGSFEGFYNLSEFVSLCDKGIHFDILNIPSPQTMYDAIINAFK